MNHVKFYKSKHLNKNTEKNNKIYMILKNINTSHYWRAFCQGGAFVQVGFVHGLLSGGLLSKTHFFKEGGGPFF